MDTRPVPTVRAYSMPLTRTDLPDKVRAVLDQHAPLEEPPQQGRTSRVAFALDVDGSPAVIKCSAGRDLEVIRREYHALCVLHPLGVPVPAPLVFVERLTATGVEAWLVMQRIPGTTLEAALRTERDPTRRTSLLTELGRLLAGLHATPLPPGFGCDDWLDSALGLATSLNPAVDATRLEILRGERPSAMATCLIHGDLFLDNVMTAAGRVTGFIDWAFAASGDPRYDVAVATQGMSSSDLKAFLKGYGPSGALTPQETAFFTGVALLW